MEKSELIERDRGILTEKDRRYLFGEVDLSEYEDPENQDYQFRWRIRNRVKNGIIDFIILSNRLDRPEREKIYQDISEMYADVDSESVNTKDVSEFADFDSPPIFEGSIEAFQFLFTCLMESTRRPPVDLVEHELRYAYQQDTAMYGDRFFYGGVEVAVDDPEENSLRMDAAAEHLKESVLDNLYDGATSNEVIADFVDFVEQLPIGLVDVNTLIVLLYRSGRLTEQEYDALENLSRVVLQEVGMETLD